MSRQHDWLLQKKCFKYATFDYRKLAGVEARTLPWTHYSHSLVPRVQKANLTSLPWDTMMQLNFQGGMWPWNLPRLYQSSMMLSLIFPHQRRLLTCWMKSCMQRSYLQGKDGFVAKSQLCWWILRKSATCFKHRRSQFKAGLAALKLHLGSDVKRKVVK